MSNIISQKTTFDKIKCGEKFWLKCKLHIKLTKNVAINQNFKKFVTLQTNKKVSIEKPSMFEKNLQKAIDDLYNFSISMKQSAKSMKKLGENKNES